MQTLEVILIAFALSIDAFAVSLAAAASGRMVGPRATFRVSFHFGLFQFLMPVLGWAAGTSLEPLIASFDHWVAFFLLAAVGLRMIYAGFHPDDVSGTSDPSRGLTLVTLSTAVSIDALAIGLSLAMLGVEIWTPSIIIGVVTSSVSLIGIFLGTRLRSRLGSVAEFCGGVVLLLIALKILLSHTA